MIGALVVAIVIFDVNVEAEDGYINPYLKSYDNPFKIESVAPRNLFTNRYLSGSAGLLKTTSSYSLSNPANVVSPEGTYLGNTNSNKYDPESIFNEYGTYGSKYSPNSVNNPYGQFGSKYSPQNANNPYASDAPKLIGKEDRNYGGLLAANRYAPDSIENQSSVKYDKPLATQRQLIRKDIFSTYAKDPAEFIEAYSELSSYKQPDILDLLADDE